MSDQRTTDAAKAVIQDALESVERIERESREAHERGESDDWGELNPEEVEVLKPTEDPPSGDPSVHGEDALVMDGDADSDEDGEILEFDDDPPARQAKPKAPKKKAAANPLMEAMIAAKNEALEVLEQTQKEAQSLQDRLVRITADYENFKKRQTREKEQALKFANESLLKELMPVLDNMERAIQADTDELSQAAKTVIEGVQMVYRQFDESMKKFGIKSFSALGEKFDPAFHEAVSQKEDTTVPDGTVIEEYQRGFLLHDRLARPSMVIVSMGGPSTSQADQAPVADEEPEAESPVAEETPSENEIESEAADDAADKED